MRDRVMTRGDALAMSAAVIVALTTVLYVTIIVSQDEGDDRACRLRGGAPRGRDRRRDRFDDLSTTSRRGAPPLASQPVC